MSNSKSFWQLQKPDYESDYDDIYINGMLEHPHGLPGVQCDVCGQTWGGSRGLPYTCPDALTDREALRNRWPLPRAEHLQLQRELLQAWGLPGQPFDTLRPDDNFQPALLDVPSLPRADFLWSGMGSLIVAQRIRDLLLEHCPADVVACPVSFRKVGRGDPALPAPIPDSGEPEDLITEATLVPDTSCLAPYYEILIGHESELPDGCTLVSQCPACGGQEIDMANRLLRMSDRMDTGHEVFRMATTLYIVVTDELKTKIEALEATNVRFENLSWTEWKLKR